MSFGPLGTSSGIANVPLPVERSGVKVSPSPPVAEPDAGSDGVCAANPMSRLTARRSRARGERVAEDQRQVVDLVERERTAVDPTRVVALAQLDPPLPDGLLPDHRRQVVGYHRSVAPGRDVD